MDLSFLPAYTVFTSIALSVAIVYLLLCWAVVLGNGVLRRFRPTRPASCRPGEVIHQALKITGRRLDQFRNAALLFGVAMLMLTLFGRLDWWPEAPLWGFGLIAFAATALQGFGVAKIVQLTRYRMRLSKLLEKHVAMAQRLAEAQLRGNRVYHSVPVGDAIIDNVIVGPNGVYSLHLFPPPVDDCESVALFNTDLLFQPNDVRYDLSQYRKNIGALVKALKDGIGSKVVVLPVIAIPDCLIEPSEENLPMVVSLESCTSFVGWKEPKAFLMNDELEAINRWLAKQSLETQSDSMRDVATLLDSQVPRPALV
ncbi:MAG: hypothetical protein KJO76_10030 [Gammaproteobacteria bacterium]|nr:hypothetical protein [Gammaproteobacteria bacterium]NND36766.1 hypothetical protein [Gammaproteobacteria bacterium]